MTRSCWLDTMPFSAEQKRACYEADRARADRANPRKRLARGPQTPGLGYVALCTGWRDKVEIPDYGYA